MVAVRSGVRAGQRRADDVADLAQDAKLRGRGRPEKMPAHAQVDAVYYAGQFVFSAAAGGLVAVPEVGSAFLGVCPMRQRVLAGERVEYWYKGIFLVPFVGVTQASVGRAVVVPVAGATNNPADSFDEAILRAAAISGLVDDFSMLVGTCVAFEAGRGWVDLHRVPGVMAGGMWT